MKTNQVNVSGAYHINLDSKNTLGLGIQGGYFQRSANTDNLNPGGSLIAISKLSVETDVSCFFDSQEASIVIRKIALTNNFINDFF